MYVCPHSHQKLDIASTCTEQSYFSLSQHAVNWVSSPDPLDTFLPAYRSDVRRVSAGTGSLGGREGAIRV